MNGVRDVGVVGGGLAGLAAAVSLIRAGVRVRIYEARPEVGGRMRSDMLGDAIVDPSVQLVSSTYSEFFGLARGCDAADLLVRAPGRDALWRGGRAHGITYGSVGSMVSSGALPALLKLRLGTRYLPFLATTARMLDANDPAGSGGVALDAESVAAWGERELGSDFVELLAYPLLAAYYGGTPEQVTAPLYHALARVGMDVNVHAVRGGAGALPQAIAAWLQARGATVSTGARVVAVRSAGARADAEAQHAERRPDDSAVRVEPEDGSAVPGVRVELEDGSAVHDAVVVATTAAVARTLLPAGGALQDWLGEVRSAPTATAAFLLNGPLDREWFGLSFPRGSEPGATIAALTAQSHKLPSLVPAGRELVVVFPAPSQAARLAQAAPEEVVGALMPGLESAYPGFGARIERARIYPFTDGYSVFYPGYLRRLAALDPAWLPSGVVLAGDYLVAPSVEGAVRSGVRAARALMVAPRPAT